MNLLSHFAAPPLMLCAMLASAHGAAAYPSPPSPGVVTFSPVEMVVVDRDSGSVLPLHWKDGRTYVAGRPGARYGIRLINHTGGRVLAVLSVDGVNVISGETASWNQTGYVLSPWTPHDINGWRKSGTNIAAFNFTRLSNSYAARTGRPDNVGVIGLAVFLEDVPIPMAQANQAPSAPSMAEGSTGSAAPASRASRDSAGSDGSAGPSQLAKAAPKAAERLGTGHGQREYSVSRETQFQRSTQEPYAITEISYDSFENLVASGVIPAPRQLNPIASPRSFPASPDFVPDPPVR